jgi:hypothetical protein
VRQILKKFDVNRTQFYAMFQGMAELCELAGVGEVKERNTRVESALEAKQRKGLDKGENPKVVVESALDDFVKRLERSKYAAMSEPSNALEYATRVVPELDPILWKRLQLLGDDLGTIVRTAMTAEGDYVNLLQRAKITRQKAPEFDEYLMGALRNYVSRRIDRGLYVLAPPGGVDDICDRCHSQLLYSASNAPYPLFCRGCGQYRIVPCPVCGTQVGALPPRMLKCGSCGYRLKFNGDLRRQVSTTEEYFGEVASGRIPVLDHGEVYVTQIFPDGRTSFIPVRVRADSVPGRVQVEPDFDRELIV